MRIIVVGRNGLAETDFRAALDDISAHLTSERQSWLFGAGISCQSGLPLMGLLTELIISRFREIGGHLNDLLLKVHSELPDSSHIEHILSQVGDMIALAE